MANAWSPTPYGYAPVYWVTIGGLPVVFAERALGLTLPGDYTIEDGSLVIDDSAEVGVEHIDRERGIGVGLDFTAKLLDTATVRDWLRRWSKSATLTANLAVGATTIDVDSTSGWPSSGALYIGLEAITYSGVTATSFTGCTRAMYGSLATAYKVGTTGQIVTDRPRFWRGRDVTLWASMASPSGHVCGATYATEAVQVWRGKVTSGPDRAPDGFVIGCQSIDRILDVPLAGKVAGKVLSTSEKYLVKPSWSISITIDAQDGTYVPGSVYFHTVKLAPFAGEDPNTWLYGAEIRSAIEAAWTTATTALGITGDLGSLIHKPKKGGAYYDLCVTVLHNATIERVAWTVVQYGTVGEVTTGKHAFGSAGMPGTYDYQAHVATSHGDGTLPANAAPESVTVALDEGDPTDVPAIGKVRVTNGGLSCTYTYSAVTTSEADLYLAGLVPVQGNVALTAGQFTGAEVEVLAVDAGADGNGDAWSSLALRCLMSSGTGARSATYDTLPAGQGYALDEDVVDEASFIAGFGAEPLGGLLGSIALAGRSFVDLFGGAAALFRRAVVARPDADAINTPIKLFVVNTGNDTAYTTTITDDDLLSHAGDPVVAIKRLDSPNMVTVTVDPDGANPLRLVYSANAEIDARGKVEVEYRIDAVDRDALATAARTATVGSFAHDVTLQAVELVVHPAVEAEVGDAIWLTTTHPAVWTWSTSPGSPGYDGPGRVTGRRVELKTGKTTLTVLIDGATRIHALSPAAEVMAFTGMAGAPTTIDVPRYYYDHFAMALSDAGGPIDVLHYQPGEAESAADGYTVSTATDTGTYCRLTVASVTGTPTIDTTKRSTLTLPLSAGVTAFQALFAHVDDGSYWG